MSTHAHLDYPRAQPDHDAMDDVGLWSESHQPRPLTAHRALPLDPAWPTRRAFIPQGCEQQGRLTPTIKAAEPFPVVVDRVREVFDADDQSESADAEVMAWLLKGLAVVLLACFCAWCIASYLVLANV